MTMYWPLTAEQDRAVRGRVAKRLAQRSHDNFEQFQNLPGTPKRTGAEWLQEYRQRPEEVWAWLAMAHPKLFVQQIRHWARLARQYQPKEVLV